MKTKELTPGNRVLLGQGSNRFEGTIIHMWGRRIGVIFLSSACYTDCSPTATSYVQLANNPHRGNPTGSVGHTNGVWPEPIEVLAVLAATTTVNDPTNIKSWDEMISGAGTH